MHESHANSQILSPKIHKKSLICRKSSKTDTEGKEDKEIQQTSEGNNETEV